MADISGVQMIVRPITVEDQLWWNRRGEKTRIVAMRGDHIGANNIEVLRSDRGPGDFQHCWRVPYIVPGGDGTTYWFTMFCEGFPPVAAVAQMPSAPTTSPGESVNNLAGERH